MSEPAAQVFERIVIEAQSELLAQYGGSVLDIEFTDPPHSSADAMVAGILGFTGERLGGVVATVALVETVKLTLPSSSRENATTRTAMDWIGELTNQLVGRVKNKMLRYGAGFMMSPPTTVRGLELNVVPKDVETARWLRFRTPNGFIWTMIELEVDRSLTLAAQEGDGSQVAAEGDMMLF